LRHRNGVIHFDEVETVQLDRLGDGRAEVMEASELNRGEEDLGTRPMIGNMGEANLKGTVWRHLRAVHLAGGLRRHLVEDNGTRSKEIGAHPDLAPEDGNRFLLRNRRPGKNPENEKSHAEKPAITKVWEHGDLRG
jgi:hypothetical protein